jgi:hypothetical protein
VALGSTNSGATAPATTFANQLWYDTANNILKIRNEDNDAWISIVTLDQSGDVVSAITAATVNAGALNATGNVVLGDASTDTLNVGNGGLIKDASGNVGVGVTPSAWDAGWKALQISEAVFSNSDSQPSLTDIGSNFYINGGADKYIVTDEASKYRQYNGEHIWYTAPSGTAGNAITFSERIRITSAGYTQFGADGTTSTLSIAPTVTSRPSTTAPMIQTTGGGGSGVYTNAGQLVISGRPTDTSTFGNVYVQTGATQQNQWTFNNAGILSLPNGSTTATGTGIAFPATQSASSDANTLDDYEEGTTSGTLTANSGAFTSASYTGRYRKVGSLVHFAFEATITTLGTGNLGFLIPLPFTADGVFGYSGTGRRMSDSVQYHIVLSSATLLVARNTASGGTLEAGSTDYRGMIVFHTS